jgi:hypothetical protein
MALALIEPKGEQPGAVFPNFPPENSPLRLERFFPTVYQRYEERFVYGGPSSGRPRDHHPRGMGPGVAGLQTQRPTRHVRLARSRFHATGSILVNIIEPAECERAIRALCHTWPEPCGFARRRQEQLATQANAPAFCYFLPNEEDGEFSCHLDLD